MSTSTPPGETRPTGAVAEEAAAEQPAVLETERVTIRYGDSTAVEDVSLRIAPMQISAVIGPSGCGKSTLLRAFNRMNDLVPNASTEGRVRLHGQDLYAPGVDPAEVRRRVGMVFQNPNPFPKSIFKNVAWGPRINGYQGDLEALVEDSLRRAALWDEVKDKLNESGLALSGGQQQRLCIARAIAMRPSVILMDEPCSALDPVSTARIEDLMAELSQRYTIVIVTHNMQQAARVSQGTAFLYQGRLIEFDRTEQMFTNPRNQQTEDYISGRFG